jgi:hypothetical protein
MSPIARIFAAAAAMAAIATAGVAVAQNYSLNPTYGVVNLAAGFTPDPYVVNVASGGSVNAQSLSASCRGFIANAPDVRLNYTQGTMSRLIISVNSAADTTLVINGPDGSWYCDDDGGNAGLNPSVTFSPPRGGQYDIWVGTYGNASNQAAQVHISELYTH